MKGGVIALIIVLVIIGIGAGAYFYLTGSSETVAYLNIDSGRVEVNKGSGWQAATDQMELKEQDSVRTLEDGQASIVFFESDIMEMQPNTEVSLTELVANSVKVNQKSGETWNRVSKLTGTREYEVETPNSVATVRGTGFGVNVSDEGDEIIVDDGIVDCSLKDRANPRQIMEYRRCMIRNSQINEGNVTKEQLMFMKARMQRAIFILEKMQLRELSKKRLLVGMIKRRYNLTDSDIRQFIDDVNTGKRDLDQMKERAGIRLRSIEKIILITEKIRELNQRLQRIDEKLASM
ncbi:FecR family protein [Candidatus Woesearchaeota archaeon]|nr:FecR family protein [Candidatus Woesearchaeota archaeon]